MNFGSGRRLLGLVLCVAMAVTVTIVGAVSVAADGWPSSGAMY
jgi:hypothetical protein